MGTSQYAVRVRPIAPGRRRFSVRQNEILDVIEVVFLREGIRAVRMGQLADEASCSRSTLYELAASKEDLLLLVLDRMMQRISRRGAEQIARAADPVARIHAMTTGAAVDLAALGPRFLEAVREHPPARLLFDQWIATGIVALEELIDDAIRAGLFRPVNPVVIAEAIFAVVMRFADPDFTRMTRVSTDTGLRELVDVFLDGLRPRRGSG